MDGSVRRAGDTMRVNARVVGVADGFQLWSSRFARPARDAFALNDEVARAIATALSAERPSAPREQLTDPVAIDLYFRARHVLGRFWQGEAQAEAAALFQQALERAPDDPTILAGFVHAQIGPNLMAPLPRNDMRALVRRALTAGGHLADPWVALAAYRFNHGDDPPGAVRALRRALEIAPSNPDAHDLAGRVLLEADVWDDALTHLERALWIDPFQRWARIDRMRAAALVGDWGKALELLEGGPGPEWTGHRSFHYARIWSWPGAPELTLCIPDGVAPRFRLVVDLFMRERESRKRSGEVPPIEELHALHASLLGDAPPRGRARRFIGQQFAELALISGHDEGAFALVESAVDAGLLDLGWMNRLSLLEPLRRDARFEDLRRTVQQRAALVQRAWQGPAESLEGALATLA